MARSVHLGEGKLQITEELWVCVRVDEGSAVCCHRAISAAVTVVGYGSCYLQHKGEAGGITTVTTKKGDSLLMDRAGISKLFFVWPPFPLIFLSSD